MFLPVLDGVATFLSFEGNRARELECSQESESGVKTPFGHACLNDWRRETKMRNLRKLSMLDYSPASHGEEPLNLRAYQLA